MTERLATKRDVAIDAVKGICMMLIIFGHLPKVGTCGDKVFDFVQLLYTFHVPVFIFLSGWFFGKKKGVKGDFSKVLNHTVKPYFVAVIILNGLYFVANKIGLATTGSVVTIFDVFRGNGGGALWYLYDLALFQLTTLVAQLYAKSRYSFLKHSVFTVAIFSGFLALIFINLFHIGVPGYFFEFFFLGYIMRNFINKLPSSTYWFLIVMPCYIFMDISRYTCANVVFVLSILLGFHGLFQLMAECKGASMIVRQLACVGRHTLFLLMFHPVAIMVIKLPLQKLLLSCDPTGILFKLCLLILVTAILIITEKLLEFAKLKNIFV